MKLDKDLVRTILLQVEAYPHPRGWVELTSADHSAEDIAHHVELLDEAGFLEADNLSDTSGYDWRAKRLTYDGHEFLDTVRDSEVWKTTKDVAKKAGVASVKMLFEVGKGVAKQKLMALGVHLP